MKNYKILYLLASLLITSCGGNDPEPDKEKDPEYVKFEASAEDFANPERGFYKYSATYASNYNHLSINTLKSYRNGITYGDGKMPVTLIFRYFVLDEYQNASISEQFLNSVQTDFDVAREAGVKLIPRFTYTNSVGSGDCAEGWVCPPYGDATKEMILGHIGQLGPILSTNSDVILAVQMGFIGIWGENYYTDYFGDASGNGGVGKLLDENWQDRIDVLNALLNALPEDMMVQVRYPQIKQRAVYGIDAPTSSAPLAEDEAFSGTIKSRIGFHNDCLFASSDDFGTYYDYGNSSTSPRRDVSTLKPYFADDSKYVLVGGETCSDGYNPHSDCSPTGMADTDLRSLHYTYLNADYNNEVNSDWIDGGCMEDIKRNMGYRVVLDSALLPESVQIGESLDINLNLTNVGYAAPMKQRSVYMVLRGNSDEFMLELDTDVRFWSDSISLSQSFALPSGIKEGAYEVLIYMPDRNTSISDQPEYSLRLANDLWEPETGMNNLGLSIVIEP